MIVGFDATTLAGHMSGVGYYTARLMESLANGAGEGVVGRLLVLSNRDLPVTSHGKLEVCAERRFPVRSFWMQFLLPGLLHRLRPDLVHFTNYLAPAVCRTPYVVSVHDMTLELLPAHHTLKKRLLTSSLVPRIARGARLVLTPSESTRRDVVRLLGVDDARIRVVPYAPGPLFRPTPQPPNERWDLRGPYFLSVGTLEPRKNLARVLRAFDKVSALLPEHRLVLVGQRGWKCDDVLREVERLGPKVVLLGYVPEEDLPALYTHATALVYASLYEGFGLPVVEAMACGAPVLTSASSSMAEVAEGAALLVDPTDVDAIAEGLHALATDASLRQDLRERGKRRVSAYSWERTGRETAQAYVEALEG